LRGAPIFSQSGHEKACRVLAAASDLFSERLCACSVLKWQLLTFEMKECTKLIARFLNFMNCEEQFPHRSSLPCRTGGQQAYGFDPPNSFGRWNLEQEDSRMRIFLTKILFFSTNCQLFNDIFTRRG
jgi:hypothetical protein